jgi:hypothetical protein
MADLTAWTGGTIGYVTATIDRDASASDYGAQSFTEMGTVKTIGAVGDTSNSINVSLLKEGRVTKVNGEKDGGEVNVTVAYDASDTSYTAIRALNNTNTNVWFEVTDPDGDIVYFQGLIANWQETERNNTTEKGASFVIRVNTGFVYA